MAENKKSFIAYVDWKSTFDLLTDAEAGRLIKIIFAYVNDENPQVEETIMKVAFTHIQQDLKRDLKKWEKYVEKQKNNGLKGGRPKTQKTQAFFQKPKKADNVNVNVNVNERENTRTLGKGKNYILVLPQMLHSIKYRINGTDGLAAYFEEHNSILNYPELSEAYMKARNGKVLNEFGHVWNDYNSFCERELKQMPFNANGKGVDYDELKIKK